jgi:hypothetical protein
VELNFTNNPYLQAMSSLRERLASAKKNARRAQTAGKYLFTTPESGSGGSDHSLSAALLPCVEGKELVWVKHPSQLCAGRIGSGGKLCLKSIGDCDIETHERTKCEIPSEPFLIPKANSVDKGYQNITLETLELRTTFIESLLEKTNVNWAKEFEEIKVGDSKTVQDYDVLKEKVQTARKQKNFATPAKGLVIKDFDEKLVDLKGISDLVISMAEVSFDDTTGERTDRSISDVEDKATAKVCDDLYSRLDILSEHAKIVDEVLISTSTLIDGYVQPLENVLSGVRLELAAIRGDIGSKDLSKSDVPQGIWNAVESGFSVIHSLEQKLVNLKDKTEEAYDVAEFLLGKDSNTSSKDTTTEEGNKKEPDDDDGKAFIKNLSLGNVDNKNDSPPPSHPSGDGICDIDPTKRSYCMNRMDGIESKLVQSLLRLSNLEESKSGSVESAIMIRNHVFRNRHDISAWCDKHFSAEKGKMVECSCFSTPHYILNLMYADMCSKRYPTIDLQIKDLKLIGILRPDATAYYAIQTDKPDFMLASTTCPSHSVKANKSTRESSNLKFIPSFADFGSSSDSESMQFRFKQSLEHVRERQEKYIESRLDDQVERSVIDISKQLLADSCKFVTQMLDFMEELYSACHESFGACTEAWDLVCHCLEELFTKELKPCLKFCVSQDIGDHRSAFIGVLHSSFSLNSKVRELIQVGLKNHHSTTTSHVRFVMKMSKFQRKSTLDYDLGAIEHKHEKLNLELAHLRQTTQKDQNASNKKIASLESKLDKALAQIKTLGEKSK